MVQTFAETLMSADVKVVKQDLDLAGDEVIFRTKLSVSFNTRATNN